MRMMGIGRPGGLGGLADGRGTDDVGLVPGLVSEMARRLKGEH